MTILEILKSNQANFNQSGGPTKKSTPKRNLFDLSYKGLTDDDVINLTEALKENNTLTKLDLRENYIGKRGINALALALCENKKLITLNLAFNRFGISGLLALAKTLRNK